VVEDAAALGHKQGRNRTKSPQWGRCVQCALQGTIPGMARPRYTTQLTFRLAPALRDDLEREAQAKGDDLGELVRDILADHTARQSVEHFGTRIT
jgi:hypothetical protein